MGLLGGTTGGMVAMQAGKAIVGKLGKLFKKGKYKDKGDGEKTPLNDTTMDMNPNQAPSKIRQNPSSFMMNSGGAQKYRMNTYDLD